MARLTMWQPLNDMLAMDAAMNQALRNRAQGGRSNGAELFPMDLVESSEGYTLYADLPGVHPDDLTIDFADSVLTVRAERKIAVGQEGATYHLRERQATTYERALRFPVEINAEAIEASYEHGTLSLYVPKAEAVKPRRITVQTSA